MVKPTMIQDDFMGDFYLGCPNCKEKLSFPLVRNPQARLKYRPNECKKCDEKFDWTDEDIKDLKDLKER